MNGRHDVLVKFLLSVTITSLRIGVTEPEFSTLIIAVWLKRSFLCHCPPASQGLPVLFQRRDCTLAHVLGNITFELEIPETQNSASLAILAATD